MSLLWTLSLGASGEVVPFDKPVPQAGTFSFRVHCQGCGTVYSLHVKPIRRDDPAERVKGEVLTVKRLREPFAKKPN